jgi:oligoribonuclease NrnB/cAMP/cGMP phosphodiesterase (DHH superfamily)
MVKQKSDTKLKATMQELQNESSILRPMLAVELYNKYIRKEGQKVLTEEEYKRHLEKANTEIILKNRRKMYPIKSKDATP